MADKNPPKPQEKRGGWLSRFAPGVRKIVSRRDTRAATFEAGYRPRVDEGGAVRNWILVGSASRNESWNGEPQESRLGIDQLGLQLQSADTAYVFAYDKSERVETDFTLFGGSTTIFAGDYRNTRAGVRLTSSEF